MKSKITTLSITITYDPESGETEGDYIELWDENGERIFDHGANNNVRMALLRLRHMELSKLLSGEL